MFSFLTKDNFGDISVAPLFFPSPLETAKSIRKMHASRLATQWRCQVPAFGGQSASVARKYGGPGKFWGATPFRRSENEGNALFSYILHHKHDYIEHKRQDVLLNLIKNLSSLL